MNIEGNKRKLKKTQAKFIPKLYKKEKDRGSTDSAVIKTNNADLQVVYDSSNPRDDGYYYRNKKNSNIKGLKKSRTKCEHWVGIDGLLKDLDSGEMNYKALRYCDPNLIEILYNEKGMDAVNSYLKQLQRGRHADKKQLPYKMAYDMDSIFENNNLSFKQKRLMLQMVAKNKHVADVKMNFKFFKKGTSLLIAMGLAFASVPELMPIHAGEDSIMAYRGNGVVDYVDDSRDESQVVSDSKQASSSQGTATDTGRKGRVDVKTNSSVQIKTAKSTDDVKKSNFTENELKLGTTFKLVEGTVFMEGISGGKVGKIGNSASPSDGIYVIDHVAKASAKGVYSMYGLDGDTATMNGNSIEFVHISLVKGAKSEEEAKKIVRQQKNNLRGKTADSSKIQPRGWMAVEDASKAMNEIYQVYR